MNSCSFTGNLARDPEIRNTSGGTSVCNATLAVNNRVKRGDQWVDEPTFIDLTIWGGRGEGFAKFHKKGSKAAVCGELRMDSWEDKQTGQKRTKLYLNVRDWDFVGAKPEESSGSVWAGSTPDDVF